MKLRIVSFAVLLLLLVSFIWKWKEEPRKEKAFVVYSEDSIRWQVDMLFDSLSLPDAYYSKIMTPVCEDTLCRIVYIDLYWDLLGNFIKYETPPGKPLTKFDHLEFTHKDHLKMKEILTDKRSLLGRYKKEELIDKDTKLISETVDAVTGATKKTVQNAVVSGAVYSSYTLWHIVNGKIAGRIAENTSQLVSDSLLSKFLYSSNYHYQNFALDHLPVEKYAGFQPEIIHLIGEGSAFVNRKAMTKIPQELWNDPTFQLKTIELYPNLDFSSQSMLLQRLQQSEVKENSLDALSGYLDGLSAQQFDVILTIILNNENHLGKEAVQHLAELMQSNNLVLSEKAHQAMVQLSTNSKTAKNALKNYANN